MNKPTQLLSVQSLTALLVACGGGAGGDVQQTPSQTNQSTSEGNSVTISRDIEAASYSISGNIVVQANARHDVDTNDFNNANGSNDTFGSAQSVSADSAISGYVNQAHEGSDGYSYSTGDEVDYFLAELESGQTITLDIADQSADLDLFIYNSSNTSSYAYSSATSASTESIEIDVSGQYYVKVEATSGASGYMLDLDQGTQASGIQAASMDFVPGEVIVKYRDDFSNRGLSAASAHSYSTLNQPEVVSAADILGEVSAQAYSSRSLLSGDTEGQAKEQTLQAVELLRQQSDVEYAEPNYRVYPAATASDPYYSKQSHYNQISLPEAWNINTGSSDVVVAVVDTGIITHHPDLSSKLVDGYDFVRLSSYSGDGDGLDDDPYDEGDPTHGIAYHGTHVAGTIGAVTNNGSGVAGVAWGAKIMPLRAITYEHGSTADLAQAIYYAAGLTNNSGTVPSKRADVINLSVGTSSNNITLRNAIEAARAAGVIIVAAAGNNATSSPHYPAAYGGVISVSAVTSSNELTSFSNYGATISVAAPGSSIYSTRGDSQGNPSYGYMSGTSMAAPHVSGVIALMKSVNPDLTPDEVDALLAAGSLTDDAGTSGKDNDFGYGIINAYKALSAAQPPGSHELHFGLSELPQNLTLEGSVADGDTLTVSSTQTWLSAVPYSVDGSGIGTYQVFVDRSNLSSGAYEGELTFKTGSQTLQVVSVKALQAEINVNAQLGPQYITLRLEGSTTPAYQLSATPSSGVLAFNFDNVEPGRYALVTGSDDNNNGVICELGESCGEFQSQVVISDDLQHLDFISSISSDASGSSAYATRVTQ